jgi:uncharacterized protein (TIGR00269 family)
VKPLYRIAEREAAAYTVLNRIDYIVEECPMARGSSMLLYKEALNRLETESPGTKHRFYLGFLDRETLQQSSGQAAAPSASSMADKDRASLHPCPTCGQPTTGPVCSYCKMMARARVGK